MAAQRNIRFRASAQLPSHGGRLQKRRTGDRGRSDGRKIAQDLQARRLNQEKRSAYRAEEMIRQAFAAHYAIEEPFHANFDLERGLRSVAFILDSLAEGGATAVEGPVAGGLAQAIGAYADCVASRAGRSF